MKDKELENWKNIATDSISNLDEGNLEVFDKEDVIDTIERLVTEIEDLERQLDEKEEEIDKLETSCQEYSAEIERLTS